MGFFEKFKAGFQKHTPTFHKAVKSLFGGKQLSQDDIDTLEEALYGADFGVETSEEILEEIQRTYRKDKELKGQEALEIAKTVLQRRLEGATGTFDMEPAADGPRVVCLIGVNGSGKTTTTAKLAKLYKDAGKSVVLGACDTFRAAANEQLHTWSERLDIPMVASHTGADAAAVAYDAYTAASKRNADILLLDTAGRLHTKTNLMDELSKIKRVLQKQNASIPHESWLVIDGSLGTNSIEQARAFHKAFGLTGLIITKLDGTSRGGALVGIFRELNLPIFYVGLGEKAEDLMGFEIDSYADAIFNEEFAAS